MSYLPVKGLLFCRNIPFCLRPVSDKFNILALYVSTAYKIYLSPHIYFLCIFHSLYCQCKTGKYGDIFLQKLTPHSVDRRVVHRPQNPGLRHSRVFLKIGPLARFDVTIAQTAPKKTQKTQKNREHGQLHEAVFFFFLSHDPRRCLQTLLLNETSDHHTNDTMSARLRFLAASGGR